MDTNLIQTLWIWWGTIPSDFRFLLLLPFAIGGTAVLVDALRQTSVAEGRRLLSRRAGRAPVRAFKAHCALAPGARSLYSCTRDPSSMTQLLGSWK